MSFSLFGFGFGGYGYMPSYLGGPAFSGFSPYYGGIAPTLGLGGLGFNGCLYGGLGLLTWGTSNKNNGVNEGDCGVYGESSLGEPHEVFLILNSNLVREKEKGILFICMYYTYYLPEKYQSPCRTRTCVFC